MPSFYSKFLITMLFSLSLSLFPSVSSAISVYFGSGGTGVSFGDRSNCTWIPAHYENGYLVQGQQVCGGYYNRSAYYDRDDFDRGYYNNAYSNAYYDSGYNQNYYSGGNYGSNYGSRCQYSPAHWEGGFYIPARRVCW